MRPLRAILELGKIRISVLATLTCAAGYVLAADPLTASILVPCAGIFLLACGASAINQIQERRLDALMDRTRNRPLPSGRISVAAASIAAAALSLSGAAILWSMGWIALGLGLLALVWYNLVYTPLKKVTAFAVVPGGLVGAIPPVVGWAAAGGNPLAPPILVLALFLFVWQVPHFWLIVLYLGRDYEKAGLPSMHSVFAPEQLARVTFAWIVATGGICLAMPAFGVAQGLAVRIALAACTVWMIGSAFGLARGRAVSYRGAFRNINIYALLVLVGLAVDRLGN
jgi:protoheme IX farnesyltransferase